MDIQNAAYMIPRAMTQIVQEGIEPLLIGERLLQKIQYKPGMTTIFPAVEPLRADFPGMDLPIYNINIAGAQSFGVQVQRQGRRRKNTEPLFSAVNQVSPSCGTTNPSRVREGRHRGQDAAFRRQNCPRCPPLSGVRPPRSAKPQDAEMCTYERKLSTVTFRTVFNCNVTNDPAIVSVSADEVPNSG